LPQEENGMNYLWLDDVRPAPDGWMHVKTAAHAISALTNFEYDKVSLDHDLGPPEAGTGYDVLTWLETQVGQGLWDKPLPELLIHSANPVGRQNMQRAITAIRRIYEKAD